MYIDENKIPLYLKLCERAIERLIRNKTSDLCKYFRQFDFTRAVVGLSGGIDSAVSLALASRALGPENVIAVRLPYRNLNLDSMQRAEEVAAYCGLPRSNLATIDITGAVEASWIAATSFLGKEVANLRIGNMAARERMKILMDACTKYKALLVGTENRTEEILAYYTIGGDNISNYEPIHNLWKTQVFQLAKGLGLPSSVLDCAPSAELWTGQTDEDEIGISYLVIDTILAGREAGFTMHYLCQRYAISREIATKLLRRTKKAERKRRSPYLPKR